MKAWTGGTVRTEGRKRTGVDLELGAFRHKIADLLEEFLVLRHLDELRVACCELEPSGTVQESTHTQCMKEDSFTRLVLR